MKNGDLKRFYKSGRQVANDFVRLNQNGKIEESFLALLSYYTKTESNALLANKLDSSKCTVQTTAPTAAIADGGVHIVYLEEEPATKYDGYIYLIKE